MNKLYVAIDGDNAGQQVGAAVLKDDAQLLNTISTKIKQGGQTVRDWVSANGGTGTAGQVLTSNGASGAPYWSTVSGGGGSVNTAAQYTWTNTQTFNANITVGANAIFGNNEVQYPKLRGYKEAVTVSNTGTAITLDLSTTNIFDLTLNNNATFTFSNPPATGTAFSFTIILHQDSVGSRTVTWPSSAKFTDNTYPILTTTANQVDIVTFFTVDGGTRYYGSFAAANTY